MVPLLDPIGVWNFGKRQFNMLSFCMQGMVETRLICGVDVVGTQVRLRLGSPPGVLRILFSVVPSSKKCSVAKSCLLEFKTNLLRAC